MGEVTWHEARAAEVRIEEELRRLKGESCGTVNDGDDGDVA